MKNSNIAMIPWIGKMAYQVICGCKVLFGENTIIADEKSSPAYAKGYTRWTSVLNVPIVLFGYRKIIEPYSILKVLTQLLWYTSVLFFY